MEAAFIDIDYISDGEKPVIRLLMKKDGFFRILDPNFKPYFYLHPHGNVDEVSDEIRKITIEGGRGEVMIGDVERVERLLFGRKTKMLKVFCKHPGHVRVLRERLKHFGDVYEADIPFARRYMVDKDLIPFQTLVMDVEGMVLKRIVKRKEGEVGLKKLIFDIEVFNPQGIPRVDKDPVIMISFADDESGVLTYKKIDLPYVRMVGDERALIKEFCRMVSEKDVELLIGYNDVDFDLPYLRDRAKALGINLVLGKDGGSFTTKQVGLFRYARIDGRLHVDMYPVIKFLGLIGAIKSKRLTLEEVYREMFSEEKKEVKRREIWRMWKDEKGLRELAEYSLADALATKRIVERVMPLQVQLSKLVGVPLQDVCGATTGQLVEMLLIREAHKQGRIVPNKPSEEEVRRRSSIPVKGAYVKLPNPGIYERIAVLDFRGMYPSIIISHNIDMDTLNCECCDEDAHISPVGHRFCRKKRGLIPSVLEKLVKERYEIKGRLKEVDKDSRKYRELYARSQALKILSNSFYGYLLYARSRWYCREAGESVTAYGRHYIQKVIRMAEERGFGVLYSDTDSVFLTLVNKKKEDVKAFLDEVNRGLPEAMELEFEGFYPRGVFVGKKAESGKGAKKKYALLCEDGSIKIRGFELVRRDWSKIAKETQRRVVEAILKEGSKERAAEIVRKVIEDLKSGRVKIEDLVIYTQIRKKLQSYAVSSPEVAAAMKARKAGIPIESGSLIGYVVTRRGGSISEKAQIAELAKDYDVNYYVEHQILPAVMKIMKELGYDEDDLKYGGRQMRLTGW